MRTSEFLAETVELDEIERLRPSEFIGGKKSLYDLQYGNHLKKLPGGSGLLYSISLGGREIKLWDPKGKEYLKSKKQLQLGQSLIAPGQLIGKLSVINNPNFPLKNAVQVNTITVDEDYRGMSLSNALYGIVLTIMKLPLLAGESQTPGGRRNWVSLVNIPGVQMKGYFAIDEDEVGKNKNINTIMGKLGGQYIGDTLFTEFFSFDVKPNTTGQELEAAVKTKLSKVYDGNYATGLYAIWTGQSL